MIDIKKYIYGSINIHYVQRYINYISSIYNKGNRELEYVEKHHIIPRCINKELYTDADNIIKLTPREHFIAHLILSKCYLSKSIYYFKLIFALFAMSNLKMQYHNRNYLINSRYYEKLRSKYCGARRVYMQEQIKSPKYDKLKYCVTNKGKMCITNGITNKYIDKNCEIPLGWYRGSTQNKNTEDLGLKLKDSWSKNREQRVGKNHPMYGKGYLLKGSKNGRYKKKLIYVNDGVKNKMISPECLDEYINNGYVKGMLKWNKTKPEINNSGENNPAYGTKLLNNGYINKRVHISEIDSYIKDGWVMGACKK